MPKKDESVIEYLTLQELINKLQACVPLGDNGKRSYYHFFAVVTQDCGVNFQSRFMVYRVKDETAVEAVLSFLTTTVPYPNIRVGDVVRVHRCTARLYNGTLECSVFKPESVVVYPKNDENQVNSISVAKNPTSHSSDIAKVKSLFVLNISLSCREPHTFSNVFDNGQEMDIIAQLVGFYVLNHKKGAFAFVWDGTKCPVEDLKEFIGFRLDDPQNKKAFDPVLLHRSKGLLHHLLVFDNIAEHLQSLEPGALILLEGVKVAFMKNTNQVYLTCKGKISQLKTNERNTVKLKDRLNKVPIPPDPEPSSGEETFNDTNKSITGKEGNNETDNENQVTNGNEEPKTSQMIKKVQNVCSKTGCERSSVEDIHLLSQTKLKQDTGIAMLTNTQKGIPNKLEHSNSTFNNEQYNNVSASVAGHDETLNYIGLESQPITNQNTGTLVSVTAEKENTNNNLEPPTSNTHQDVLNTDSVTFETITSESKLQDIIPNSRNKKRPNLSGMLTLEGKRKKFYIIPQYKLIKVRRYLGNFVENENTDSSKYVTAESSPINTHNEEIEKESQSSILACVDSKENEKDDSCLQLDSSSCSSLMGSLDDSGSNLSNLSMLSIEVQVGSQLELPETFECTHSEGTESQSLLQNLTHNYVNDPLVSKTNDLNCQRLNETSTSVENNEVLFKKVPFNTWGENVKWIEEIYLPKFEKAETMPLRRKKKN